MKHQKTSIKKNSIVFDPSTKTKDICDILNNRFENGEFILEPKFEDLHDPYELKDMDKAVARIKQAKENNETIMIF